MPSKYSDQQAGAKKRHEVLSIPPKSGIVTLDEPILVTLSRDLWNIYYRTRIIFRPATNAHRIEIMGNYDLWGPSIYILALSLICSIKSHEKAETVFSTAFLWIFLGCILLTINGKCLESRIGYLQTISIIGYSTLPTLQAAFISIFPFIPRVQILLIAVLSCIWSIKVSSDLATCKCDPGKKLLIKMPIIMYQVSLVLMLLKVL